MALGLAAGSLGAGITSTPRGEDHGNAVVLEAVAWPQPNPRWVHVRLYRSAQTVRLQVFDRGWHLVAERSSGPCPGGWNRLALPDEFQSMAAGTYFFLVDAGGQREHAQRGVLVRSPR